MREPEGHEYLRLELEDGGAPRCELALYSTPAGPERELRLGVLEHRPAGAGTPEWTTYPLDAGDGKRLAAALIVAADELEKEQRRRR